MNYYFLAAYLPDIGFDDRKIRVGFGDVLNEREHIASLDWREIELILLGRDILMIERLLAGRPLEVPFSVYSFEFWREQIKSPREGPAFILEFLEQQNPDQFGPQDAARLWRAYYAHVHESSRNEFLKSWFEFELTVKNVIAAIRARRLARVPGENVIGENDVTLALSRSNAEDFGLVGDYPWIESLTGLSDPASIQTAVESIFWNYLETKVESEFAFDFSITLSYLLRLERLEKRLGLNQDKGVAIVRELEGI